MVDGGAVGLKLKWIVGKPSFKNHFKKNENLKFKIDIFSLDLPHHIMNNNTYSGVLGGS